MIKRGILLNIVVLFFICVFASTFLIEQVLADEITLISYNNASAIIRNQDLEYTTCIDGTHKFGYTQLICNDNYATIPTAASKVSDKCYYSAKNLETFDCNEYILESYYIKDGQDRKLSKIVTTNTVLVSPTHVLDSQSWDGGWDGASNTAFAIWVLSKYGEVYRSQINDAMSWLKDNRRNEPKCWINAQGQCSPLETIKALAYLKLANITEGNRIVSDGMAYAESLQKYIANAGWSAKITTTQDDTYCNLSAGGTVIINNVLFNESQYAAGIFSATYGKILNMSCTERVRLTLYDNRGAEKFSYSFSEDSAVDFDEGTLVEDEDDDLDERYKIIVLQQPCWSLFTDQWGACDASLSTYALSLNIDKTQLSTGKTWLLTQLMNHSVSGKFISSLQPVQDTAMYLLTVDPKNTDMLDWLIYSQNNDGSFGSGIIEQRIKDTASAYYALQKLTFAQKSEVLKDAAHWASITYTGDSWEDVKTDGSIFQILSVDARAYLRAKSAGIVNLKNDIAKTIEYKPAGLQQISNFSAKVFTASGDASDALTVTLPTVVSGNSSLFVTLQSKVVNAGNVSGYVLLKGMLDNATTSKELRKIYFTVERDPIFSIASAKTKYNVYDNEFKYLFNVESINLPVTCNVQISSEKFIAPRQISLSVAGAYEMPITIRNLDPGLTQVGGQLVCDIGGKPVIIPFDIDAIVHDRTPFAVSPDEILITKYSKTFKVKVTNLLDEEMDLTVELLSPSELYLINNFPSTVEKNGEQIIEISTTYLESENVSDTNALKITAFDKIVVIPMVVTIAHTQSKFMFMILFPLIVTLVATAGYIAYNWSDYKPQFQNIYAKLTHGKSIASVGSGGGLSFTKKKDVARSAMMDIIAIMQSMDKSEPEIIAKLESEGYSRAMVEGLIEELKVVQAKVSNIKREDTVLGIIKGLDSEIDVVTKVLKAKGYTENEIREALAELSMDTSAKEKKLRSDAGISSEEKIT